MPEHIEIDLWEDIAGGLHFHPGGTDRVFHVANVPASRSFLEDCDDWLETGGRLWEGDGHSPIEQLTEGIQRETVSVIATWRSDSPDIVQVHGTFLLVSANPGHNGQAYLGLTEEEMVDVRAKPPFFLRRQKEKGAE